MKTKTDKILNIILPIISIGCIIVVWAISASAIGNEFILPTLSLTFNALINLFADGGFYLSVLGTLLRSLIAFFLSFVIGLILAILSNKYKRARSVIKPIISIVRALPTIAVVLFLLLWTNSFVAPVVVTMLVVLPTMFTNISTALESVDKKQIEMCKLYNVKNRDVLSRVIIPQITPSILTVIGAGISLNLKLMVATEVLSYTARSLGYILITSKMYFETATMFAVVFVTVVIGVLVELVFNLISKKVGKWQ